VALLKTTAFTETVRAPEPSGDTLHRLLVKKLAERFSSRVRPARRSLSHLLRSDPRSFINVWVAVGSKSLRPADTSPG
jgi:hypothetical protein